MTYWEEAEAKKKAQKDFIDGLKPGDEVAVKINDTWRGWRYYNHTAIAKITPKRTKMTTKCGRTFSGEDIKYNLYPPSEETRKSTLEYNKKLKLADLIYYANKESETHAKLEERNFKTEDLDEAIELFKKLMALLAKK